MNRRAKPFRLMPYFDARRLSDALRDRSVNIGVRAAMP
jgi:hypothetical protein